MMTGHRQLTHLCLLACTHALPRARMHKHTYITDISSTCSKPLHVSQLIPAARIPNKAHPQTRQRWPQPSVFPLFSPPPPNLFPSEAWGVFSTLPQRSPRRWRSARSHGYFFSKSSFSQRSRWKSARSHVEALRRVYFHFILLPRRSRAGGRLAGRTLHQSINDKK